MERVEVKDIRLPHELRRVLAAEAEAAREAGAKVVAASGELNVREYSTMLLIRLVVAGECSPEAGSRYVLAVAHGHPTSLPANPLPHLRHQQPHHRCAAPYGLAPGDVRSA